MRRNGTIVILSAGYGDGHVQVSATLERKFGQFGFDNVRIVDLFREAHPAMNAFSKFLYAQSPALSGLGLDYYGWSYYLTRDMKQDGMMSKWLGTWGLRKLSELLRSENPVALVSTFPFSGVFEHVRKRGIAIPTFTVVTDFTLHNRWLSSSPDLFFVATDDLKRAMVERGVPERRISVTGIPIRDSFYDGEEGRSPRDKSVLIMAGAFGVLRDIRSMTMRLLEFDGTGVSIVCGRNESLRKELEETFAGHPNVRVFGYVERVDRLMRGASCMVTKAGGVTLSEAIQIGIPTLLYKPFPGQEKENAIYLESKGYASISHSIEQMAGQARRILEGGGEAAGGESLRREGRAADEIVKAVERSLGRPAKPRANKKQYIRL
ncbi:MGDG synthase family glycosyltransferase [Paenibacillus sp. GYB003]|uniref:MGDG synthase family glycosyltransferase n=1 Tax=Paenibacillus sp. GYB003 TaxID=2994392 RepID=UPI002F96BE6D